MREIKFRAWDKTENKMARSVKEMRFNHKGLYAVTLNHMGFEFKRRINDVILEQYTGLKDKNGKEIYEGDVVSDMWNNLYTPVFQNGIYMAYNPKHLGLKNDPSTQFNIIWKDGCEIIGNIHDNPELLEVGE